MMKRHGFTLIELLVVIAIIAILAAILFPVFAQAREKARQTQCLSNAKQIGTAIMMYGQDYDETYIPWFVRTGLARNQYRDDLRSWVQNLQPYLKSGEPSRPAGSGPFSSVPPNGIMACPSYNETRFQQVANDPSCDDGALDSSWWTPQLYHAHYGIGFGEIATGGDCSLNNPYYKFAGSDVRVSIMSFAKPLRPAETAIVTDGFTGIIRNGGFGTTMGCEAADSHAGGGVLIFCDGHAKWIARNSERYRRQDASGCWYKIFYAVDKE